MPTNFLHALGTNGLISPAFQVTSSTELNVASSGTVTCSVTFSQSNFGQAQRGVVAFQSGTSFTPASPGANVAGWWLLSQDGGTTFESTGVPANSPLPRSPDFIIPFSTAATVSSAWYVCQGAIVPLPNLTAKVFFQNNAGVTIGASALIQVWPVAEQY